MNKPIGILTFHRASNYGAVLQAYALQAAFGNIGQKAVIVDYYCPVVEEDHRPLGLFKRHKIPQAILRFPIKAHKDRLFNAFRKRKLVTSAPVDPKSISSIADSYSLFVSGSDQVWSDRFSGLDPAYMLDFAREEQRYSYACSFGFDAFPAGKEEVYLKLLRGIRCISLRESSGVEMLEKAGLKAHTDLDPTLLLSAEEWRSFSAAPAEKDPYILVYTVNGDVHLLEYARALSEKKGCKILYLNNQYKNNRDLKRIRYASPEEFVGWFANAEYVLTNSFHGTAFSIIFHRKFKVELETKKKYNVRSRDLLLNCGLSDCILKNGSEDFSFTGDWGEPDRLLGNMREKSVSYIRMISDRAEEIGKVHVAE